MEPSTELGNVVLRFYEDMGKGDVKAVDELFSRQRGVLAIGSDPTEWWADHGAIISALEAQFRGMGTRPIIAGDLQAFVEGTVGWTVDRRTMRLASGKEIVVRETLVFHWEDEAWKIVQFHASLALPNAEILG